MKRFRKYKIISLLSTLVFLGGVNKAYALFGFSLTEIQLKIANTILTLVSQVLRLAGILFNYVIDYTINFSALVTKVGVVDIGWTTFRNLSNMVFIFILLAISIATILGIQNYSAKQLLTKVILVALLINFSLFATKIIIDAANVFTVGFYNATIEKADQTGINGWDKGISSMFASSLNLHTIYKQGDFVDSSKDETGVTLGPNNIWTVCIMGSVFLIVTAFVFFAASILLIKRIVVLMFLMMLSPLAFLGMILPATSGYSKQWWNTLFKEAFYAPVFMMFIYVVALGINSDAFRNSIGKASATTSFANTFTGGAGDGMSFVIFNFILIIGLMLASIVTASKLGASGANAATKFAGKAAFGLPAFAGKQTLGRAMRPIRDKIAKTEWAKREGLGSKLALKTFDSSFDIRNIKSIQEAAKSQKIDISKPSQKGGYATSREKSVQSVYKYTKGLTDTEREAYANKPTNIFAKIAGTGRTTAVKNIQNEYVTKKAFKEAQGMLKTDIHLLDARQKLTEAQDNLKKIKEKREPTDTEKQTVYTATAAVRDREAKIKEGIEKAKGNYDKAKKITEVKKSKDKKDKGEGEAKKEKA